MPSAPCAARPSHNKVGDAVERQLHRHGQGGQKLEHDDQCHGDQNALKGLFFCFLFISNAPCFAVQRMKNGWFSTGFSAKNGYSTVLPAFSTQFSCKKALFHASFSLFPQNVLKTRWKLLKSGEFFHRKTPPIRTDRESFAVHQISKISQSSSTFLQADSTFSMVA